MVLSPGRRVVCGGVLVLGLGAFGGGCSVSSVLAEGPALVTLDGSSTVFPLSEAVAEEFQKANPRMRVTVGISGTGGGFQKFCRGESDVSDASRPITPVEIDACAKAGIDYIELPVAYDGIAIAVNPRASWIDHITVAELKTMWAAESEGKVMKWSQIREGWPDREIHLFGAGVDSGTYDYFTNAVTGTAKSSRGDFTSSEDDNVLVEGVATDDHALGFVPFSYYEDNQDKLKLVPVDDGRPDNGNGPITPSAATIRDHTYQPLARPVFIYVTRKAAARPDVQAFVEFYLSHAEVLATEVNLVGLGDSAYQAIADRFATTRDRAQ